MVGDILQPTHLLFILIVALLVLGPKRLPEMAKTLGSGLRDFRAALNGEREQLNDFKSAFTGEHEQLNDFKSAFTGEHDTSSQPDTPGLEVGYDGTQTAARSDVSTPEPSLGEPSAPHGAVSPEREPTVAEPEPAPAGEPALDSQPSADSSQDPESATEQDPAPAPDPVTSVQHRD